MKGRAFMFGGRGGKPAADPVAVALGVGFALVVEVGLAVGCAVASGVGCGLPFRGSGGALM